MGSDRRTLTITAKGQVALGRDLLRHPGERIAADKLPDGRIGMRASRATANIADMFDRTAATLIQAQGGDVRLLS